MLPHWNYGWLFDSAPYYVVDLCEKCNIQSERFSLFVLKPTIKTKNISFFFQSHQSKQNIFNIFFRPNIQTHINPKVFKVTKLNCNFLSALTANVEFLFIHGRMVKSFCAYLSRIPENPKAGFQPWQATISYTWGTWPASNAVKSLSTFSQANYLQCALSA